MQNLRISTPNRSAVSGESDSVAGCFCLLCVSVSSLEQMGDCWHYQGYKRCCSLQGGILLVGYLSCRADDTKTTILYWEGKSTSSIIERMGGQYFGIVKLVF